MPLRNPHRHAGVWRLAIFQRGQSNMYDVFAGRLALSDLLDKVQGCDSF